MSRQRRIRATMVTVAVVVVGAAIFLVGAAASQRADWRTGTALVRGEPANPEVVITDASGWDYAVAGGVDWIDRGGTVHFGDRLPGCLRAVPLGDRQYGDTHVIRFATVTVDVEGVGGSRIVAAIDCRGAS
jgi:hypothetical protein